MPDRETIKRELISELGAYSDVIIDGTERIIEEYRGKKEKDSDALFQLVVQGINWEIEVFNSCEDRLNRGGEKIDKQEMAMAVGRLGSVLSERNDSGIADCLETDFLPFLRSMQQAALAVA